jgi:hypothetical protein
MEAHESGGRDRRRGDSLGHSEIKICILPMLKVRRIDGRPMWRLWAAGFNVGRIADIPERCSCDNVKLKP